MRSNGPTTPSVHEPTRMSARPATPHAATLRRATSAAAAEISTPRPRALTNSRSSAQSSAPDPTPRSRTRSSSRRLSAKSATAASTIVSVSGRGSSTSGEIVSARPQNSRLPTIFDRGSPETRLTANSSSRAAAPPRGASGAAMRAADGRSAAAQSASRASRTGSSSSERRNCSTRNLSASARVVPALKRVSLKRPARGSA